MSEQPLSTSPTSRRRVLRTGLVAGAIITGATAPAAAGGARGGGGVGYITDVGWDKLADGTAAFEFTGVDLANDWRVPSSCRNHRNLKRSNNVRIRNVDSGEPLGLLLPRDRHVPESGSGPYTIAHARMGCGTSPDDTQDRQLIQISFKPETPRR